MKKCQPSTLTIFRQIEPFVINKLHSIYVSFFFFFTSFLGLFFSINSPDTYVTFKMKLLSHVVHSSGMLETKVKTSF